jgi:hypothetical protein
VLLAPPFATLDTLLSAVDDDIGWRLIITAQDRLPASLGWAKHDHFVASGVQGGDTMRLPECVPKKVAMLTLERAPYTVLGQYACALLVSLTAGPRF